MKKIFALLILFVFLSLNFLVMTSARSDYEKGFNLVKSKYPRCSVKQHELYEIVFTVNCGGNNFNVMVNGSNEVIETKSLN